MTVIKDSQAANVLVVDDNIVNLKVAAGLLVELGLRPKLAASGALAVEMAKSVRFDIVFMDHLMPDMDGIETSNAIRKLADGYYKTVPILALTANVSFEAEAMLKAAGLDDYLTKPIDIFRLYDALEKWLPYDKRQSVKKPAGRDDDTAVVIPGVDTSAGLTNSGGVFENYVEILGVFAGSAESTLDELEKSFETGDFGVFAIHAHSLRGACANIGAASAAGYAGALERAGKDGDGEYVSRHTGRFCETVRVLISGINEYLCTVPSRAGMVPEVTTSEKLTVMVVDDNITNLAVARKALEGVYNVIAVSSGREAVKLLENILPALILLDVEMPEMDGFETLRILKRGERTCDIPVIFLTAKDDRGSEIEGLRTGAVDYITKPFAVPLLLQRVGLHIALVVQRDELRNYNENLSEMVREQTEIISELQRAIIYTLSELIEFRDGLTGGHVERTQRYLQIMANGLRSSGFYKDEIENIDIELLVESAQLHDIGKIGIPDSILNKPGRLSGEEFEVIKSHTLIGEKAIKNAMRMTRAKEFLSYAAIVAVSHHERWDGGGYPHGLAGEEIPLPGRLMAIADVYDALVSRRSYKDAYSHTDAVKIITEGRGTQFDPVLVDVFLMVADKFLDCRNSGISV